MTVVDGTVFLPSESFTKTWRIKNTGTCIWTDSYRLIFVSGDKMNGPDIVSLPGNIAPGETFDLSVNLTAPDIPGEYQGFWELQNSLGQNFGFGATGLNHIWARIQVITPPLGTATLAPAATPSVTQTNAPLPSGAANITYDFAGQACAARWESNNGVLPCPGTQGDTRGSVLPLNNTTLENGTTTTLPALLAIPASTADGYIQATYPEYTITAGDHLQTTVSCEAGATSCSVLFRIGYQDASATVRDLWSLGEFYDGQYFNLNLDLSQLAGERVRFILSVTSLGSAEGDHALWVAPRIVHFAAPTAPSRTPTSAPSQSAAASVTPGSTPTNTSTPTPASTSTPVLTATPTPAGQPGALPSIPQILDYIVSFFRNLLGR